MDQGLKLTEFLTRRFPGRADVWQAYAGFLHESNQPLEAVAAYKKAVELGDESPTTRLSLVDALFVSGQRAEALRVLTPLVQDPAQPIYASACIAAAGMHELNGGSGNKLINLAEEALSHKSSLDFSQRVAAIRLIAEGHGRNGDSKEQEQGYLKALELAKQHPPIDSLLLMKIGEFYQAQPTSASSNQDRANSLTAAGTHFKQLVEVEPKCLWR